MIIRFGPGGVSAVAAFGVVCCILGIAPAAHATAAQAPADVAHLTISPGSQRVPAGLARSLTARAYDSDGNPLGDVTFDTTFSMVAAQGGDTSSAHCDGNYCTAHDPGGYVIVGSYINPDRTFAWGTAKMRATAPIVMGMSTSLHDPVFLYDGTMFQGHDTATYSNGDQADVTRHGGWMVEDTSVATVTAGGRITAVAPGTTQLDFGVGGFHAYVALIVDRRRVSITSVSPNGGYVNDQITVRGTNLDTVQTARVGTVRAYVQVLSPRQVKVFVPSGATSGPITLTTGHGYVSAPFTVYH